MKIAFVMPNLKAGGGNRSQIMLANGLAEKGHNVSILVPRGHVAKTPLDINVSILETGLEIKNHYLTVLINYPLMGLKLFRYDVIVATFSITVWFCWFPWVFFNKKVIYYARGYDPAILEYSQVGSSVVLYLYRFLSKKSYILPVELVVNSQWTGKLIQKNIKKPIKYSVINNGIDHYVFKPISENIVQQRQSIRILTVGKKQRFKGFIDIINALEAVYKKCSDFKFYVMTPDNMNIPKDLSYQVEIIKPKCDMEIAEQFQKANIFVSASWFEGFGNPPLEAMACGASVVLTDSGGVKEYAVDEENCLMSSPKDSGRLAENILRLIKDKDLRNRIASNGLSTAQNFKWQKSIFEFERLICN